MNLINDIIDLSKIEAGQMDFETKDFDPEEIIDEVFCLFPKGKEGKGKRRYRNYYRKTTDQDSIDTIRPC